MYTKRQKVNIDDTRFIFTTNFSGDPERDRFGSDQRRVNVVIPTEELAQHLLDLGVKVKQTKPNPERTYDEPFVPTLYVPGQHQDGLQVAAAHLLGHNCWQAPALQRGHHQPAGLHPCQERLPAGKSR